MKKTSFLIIFLAIFTQQSCGIYSFNSISLSSGEETVQIDYFPNNAVLVEPTLSQYFTIQFQDKFLSQTNLEMVKSGGDLQFEGEITGYKINPTTATAEQTAAQNRLTITVNVRFFNNRKEEDNFERTFSHFQDFAGDANLSGDLLNATYEVIIERITQDIFNASVAKW